MFDFLASRFSDFGPLTVLLTVLGLFCLYLFCLISDCTCSPDDYKG